MTRSVVCLAVLAAACASAQPAPISYGGAAIRPAPPQAPQASRDEDGAAGPAARAETALSAYALRPDDAHPFDPAHPQSTHRVGRNETLYDIATLHQAPLRALIDQNALAPPYALTPGRVLQLPPPRFHLVERGETLADVARRYNVDTRSLALLNRMQAPYRVRAGDRVVLPAMARAQPASSQPQAGGPAQSPRLTQLTSVRFTWPLRGEIVARFGAQSGGARLDGVEIAGREGATIVAAADGEVVYAGSDLPAYGTLVLVRHADNFVTAYGNARRAAVREGQHVRAGEAIAELGARPSGPPRLLFQVRRGASAIDPAPLLGALN